MNKAYYKYCSVDVALDIIRRPRLYFTPPEFFNDIYEMCPRISKDISRRNYLRYFYSHNHLRRIYESLIQSKSYAEPYDLFYQKAKSDRRTIKLIYERLKKACEGLEKKFSSVMNKHVGVSCMTTINNSNLMWAHYADSHKGVCIGYNIEHSDITLIDNRAVEYRNTKVSLPAWVMELPDKERYGYYSKVAFSKSKEWYYEKEHRFLANLEQCRIETRNGATYYYQELDKRDIDQVILGIRCKHERDIVQAISQENLNSTICRCMQYGKAFALSVISTT